MRLFKISISRELHVRPAVLRDWRLFFASYANPVAVDTHDIEDLSTLDSLLTLRRLRRFERFAGLASELGFGRFKTRGSRCISNRSAHRSISASGFAMDGKPRVASNAGAISSATFCTRLHGCIYADPETRLWWQTRQRCCLEMS